MTNIGPGTLVECIKDDWQTEGRPPEACPIKGWVYTVRAVHPDRDSIRLTEIKNPVRLYKTDTGQRINTEIWFILEGFRPIDHRPEFTEWLEGLPTEKELV